MSRHGKLRFSRGQVDDEGLTVGASAPGDPGERRRAVRQVATLARDAADCGFLLGILGLEAVEGVGDQTDKETR